MRSKSSRPKTNCSASRRASPCASSQPADLAVSRRQEKEAIEQLHRERQRYNDMLAREKAGGRKAGASRAAPSQPPRRLANNFLSRAPTPEEIKQKRAERRSNSGSEADVSSDTLTNAPVQHGGNSVVRQPRGQVSLPAIAPQKSDPRQSTLARIDDWALPQTQQAAGAQGGQSSSPSVYSQLTGTTSFTDPAKQASRGRSKLIKAVRQ